MDNIPKLEKQQGLVYCWKHDYNPNAVKIGKSTVGQFYNSVVITSKRWLLTPPEFLGFQIFPTADEAKKHEDTLHTHFGTIGSTEFVFLSDDVRSWIENECLQIPLEHFKNISRASWKNRNRQRREAPEFREKQKEYKKNQSQRARDSVKSEIARKEKALERANAVLAEITQDTTDE